MEINTNVSTPFGNIERTQADTSKTAVTKKAEQTPVTDQSGSREAKAEAKQPVSKEEMAQLVEELNREILPLTTDIRFSYSAEAEALLVSIIDTKTDRLIRQIPSDEAIKLAIKMREFVGMLFDKTI